MKFVAVFFALVGLACAVPLQTTRSQLQDDIDDYIALIPKAQFVALYYKYQDDPDIQKIVAYLHSEDFAKVAHIIAGNDQIQDLVNYIEGEGVAIKDLINRIADRLGLPHWPAYSNYASRKSTRSLQEFLDEAIALLPLNDIIALTFDKLANSEAFQNLYMKISSMDGQKLHDDALSHPEIIDLIERLNNLGVDTKKIWAILQTIFGWGYSSRTAFSTYSLKSDIYDYLALIPVEEYKALYKKYENDAEVQALITRIRTYLHSEDFAKVAHIIAQNDQIQDLVNYIEGEGVAIKEVINRLADRLGLPHWPGTYRAVRNSRSVQSFLEEAIALLPLNDIIALTFDKLANSEAFQNLYMKISSMDGQKLHDDALSHPEIVDLIERLNNLGVDTKKIWAILQTIFGWGYSSRTAFSTYSLKSDIYDYLALIPVEEYKALYKKYENDAEVQALITRIRTYLHSEDFAKVAHIISQNDQIQDLVNYIEGEGVAIKEVINRLADRLGLPHWPGTYRAVRNSRSVQSFLEEAIALLPLNDIIALTFDKLANSEAFQNLYMKISSMDGKKLHDDALSHPEIVDLIERLNNLGVDTKKIWAILQTIFGWGYSSRTAFSTYSLKSDIYDYLALIPVEEYKALYKKYENDAEVQALITRIRTYLHSEDFAKVAHIISQNDQIQDLVNYIEGEGVAIKEVINRLADRLGLPHWPGTYRAVRNSRSVQSFLEEAIALLPLNDIIALTFDKLANSEAFQNLYMKISSMDGQKLHDDALSHPEIVDLIERLNNLGVDTKKIWAILQTIFGW